MGLAGVDTGTVFHLLAHLVQSQPRPPADIVDERLERFAQPIPTPPVAGSRTPSIVISSQAV